MNNLRQILDSLLSGEGVKVHWVDDYDGAIDRALIAIKEARRKELEGCFPTVKSEVSSCICKAVVFVNAKIPETALNLLANEFTDKILEAIGGVSDEPNK